jgi:RNA polymerase sigma-70 factor (ECF subfamily)
MAPAAGDITALLQKVNEGCTNSLDELMAAVYKELRAIADRHMRREFGPGLPGLTLQPTALVNETFLKLIKQRQKYDNRGHFFAISTKLMLRVLMDYQRRRNALKRGGRRVIVSIDPDHDAVANASHESCTVDIAALVKALQRLEALDARKSDVVKLRVLFGLTLPEVAHALGVGQATVERDWAFARAWLRKELAEGET